jgi:ABC-type sugar transport system substrate-binding protein
MTSTRRRASLLLALCASGVFSAACGDDSKQRPAGSVEEVADRVGIVLPVALQPSYRTLQQGLVAALREAGHEAVVEDGITDVAQQAALLGRITARKARAIVVAPLDSVALRPIIDAAGDASIPVFTVGLPVPGARVTTHMEADHFATGVIAAEYLSAFIGPGVTAGVVGRLGAHGSREVRAGFDSLMSLNETRVNAGAEESSGTVEGAAAATSALLDREPALKGIVALDPISAQGAASTLFARRRADVIIVSVGATEQTLAGIREERVLRAAIVERVDEGARLLAAAIDTQLKGEPVTPSIKVPVRLVNIDSLRARPGN